MSIFLFLSHQFTHNKSFRVNQSSQSQTKNNDNNTSQDNNINNNNEQPKSEDQGKYA
jgi:hypothetical protein